MKGENEMKGNDLMTTINTIIPTPNGDTICICNDCAHALAGFDARDAYLDEYTRATLEGATKILFAQTIHNAHLHDCEQSDSNLITRCDCCNRPHEHGEFYAVLESRTNK